MSLSANVPKAAPVRMPQARWASDSVFEMVWYDDVDRIVAEHGLMQIRTILGGRKPSVVFIDASHMTGYRMDCRAPAIECLRTLKESQMEWMIAVMPRSAIRMFLSAMAMAVTVKISFVDDRSTALQLLRTHGYRLDR